MRLNELPIGFVRTVVVAFGLIWGSFLNVVIYRVPREMSVVHPGSRCPACGAPIRAWENVPVLSWVLLRGRARCCGARVSVRYPLVELSGGALSLAVFEVLVRALPPEQSEVGHAALYYLVHFALCLGLVAAAFIDLEHMYLPDAITIGGVVLGLATAPLRGLPFREAAIGAVGGYFGVWLPFIVLYRVVRGRPGMGLGDAKLLALAGAWFGWLGASFVLFAGAIQGTLGSVAIYVLRGKIAEPASVKADREELQRAASAGDIEAQELLDDDPLGAEPEEGLGKARIPFGPFLILAIFEWMFAGDIVLGWLGP
jgi:leader peptidase (prepilin peptidase)/N-methyltransferase